MDGGAAARDADPVGDAVRGAFALGIKGMNVTFPYKQAVIPYLAEIDETARAMGAVNTLVRTEHGFKGYNTDSPGLLRAIREAGVEVSGRPAIILGAGGVAKATAYALLGAGASPLYILNRNVARAEKLRDEMREIFGGGAAGEPPGRAPSPPMTRGLYMSEKETAPTARAATWQAAPTVGQAVEKETVGSGPTVEALSIKDFPLIPSGGYLVIQATSVGMHPDNDGVVIADDAFYQLVDVGFDCIYTPCETAFMKRVRAAGKRAYNGLPMLLYQGIVALSLWRPWMSEALYGGAAVEDATAQTTAAGASAEGAIAAGATTKGATTAGATAAGATTAGSTAKGATTAGATAKGATAKGATTGEMGSSVGGALQGRQTKGSLAEEALAMLARAAGKNIVLIGFMGSGKTSVGRELSRAHGWETVDLDTEIERMAGMPVRQIFEERGEACFREMETAALRGFVGTKDHCVFSMGGGVPMREENRELMRRLGTVVYLKTDASSTLARLAGDTGRPLLAGDDRSQKVEALLCERGPIYESAADVTVDTVGKAVAEVAGEVCKLSAS
ncbi:MAG: hypothetical protein LBR77_02910 [Lachnospiraceae bacterium]|nr:hypothetical protein [Lachnospiraceae bacterium]